MKFLFPTPVVFDGNDERFLQRDGARFAEYLSSLGHQAIKVILDDGREVPGPRSHLLLKASWEQWHSSEFWKQLHPDAILLYGGLSREMLPVVQAMKSASINVSLKMDTAFGVCPFPSMLSSVIVKNYWKCRESSTIVGSVVKSVAVDLNWVLGRTIRFCKSYLPLFDCITVESNLAVENTKRFLVESGLDFVASRVRLLHHPVPHFYQSNGPKKNRIVAFALDWNNPRKCGRMMAIALARAFLDCSNWDFVVIGNNSERVLQWAPSLAGRISCIPRVPSKETMSFCQESKILLMPSGSEGSPNVVFEALCCGCSVVFSSLLPQLSELITSGAGRKSLGHTATAFSQAVREEISCWDSGVRNADSISTFWITQARIDHVVKTWLNGAGLSI